MLSFFVVVVVVNLSPSRLLFRECALSILLIRDPRCMWVETMNTKKDNISNTKYFCYFPNVNVAFVADTC